MYLSYVNIEMGANSVMRYSRGNTLPLTQMPFGMVSFCPQTERIKGQEGWFYNPNVPCCEGVRLTHQPSPWIGDYGTFLMVPQNDIVANTASGACTSFKSAESVLSPSYLKMRFMRSNSVFELAPTERGCVLRVQLLDERKSYLSFLAVDGNYTYFLDKEKNTLYATNDAQPRKTAKGFKAYLVVKFEDSAIDYDSSYQGDGYIHISLASQRVEARVGLSYISFEMAEKTIVRECSKPFEEIRAEGEECWEEKLARIEIDTDDEEQKRTFYSCMYRCFLFPHKAYELDENQQAVHYSACDGSIRPGVLYTDTGFWDTSRTQFPLFAKIAKKEYCEMLEGFVNIYKENGYLPRWHSIDEVGCMPSTLIDPVILDAVYNGIGTRSLWETALEGMVHHASVKGSEARFGRNGVEEYNKYGYVPADLYKESVNLTLDAAYGDWCISQIARLLGKTDIEKEYAIRSKSYENIFDKNTGFMRGKNTDGQFREPFYKTSWGIDYTEGSAYQNSHFVPHDIEGLCSLYGGRDNLIARLDEIFDTSPTFRVFGYGCEIHEMSEMAQADYGQCAISNQPSFHIPYLYAYLGKKEKAEYWVERMCKEQFSAKNGYPGDEDNGSMSAWYILSTLGMYPLCAGKEMIRLKPLVKSAKILGKQIF
ncbi:MAG: GH92 family glycosyl hydrolase [Clostridia bacterium]|nr:GH92 family glycosyl hydrolase [Clostridia bacterium]